VTTVTVESPTERRAAAIEALPAAAAYIHGEWSSGKGQQHTHIDPATGEELKAWALCGPAQVDRAVQSASEAQTLWAATDPATRRDLMLALSDVIGVHTDTLAALVSLEMGMPLKPSQAGVRAAIDWFRHYAGYADKIEGTAPIVGRPDSTLDYTRRDPYGVVAAIIPWNGPVMAAARKVAPALAAGNAVVLKPSERAPFSCLHLASLMTAAGLPAGLVNVVAGGPDTGARLCANRTVAMISFTGGGVGGRAVAEAAAARHIPTVLELGGKSASLVFPDVDVERTAKLGAILGIAQNSGQGCFFPTRLLLHHSIYDQTLDGVVTAAR
jgi:aldehyde dehydrogenase (NAD+)